MNCDEIEIIYRKGIPYFHVWSEYGYFYELGTALQFIFNAKLKALKNRYKKGFVIVGDELVTTWGMDTKAIEILCDKMNVRYEHA